MDVTVVGSSDIREFLNFSKEQGKSQKSLCWTQRATNESMHGGYGILPVADASDAQSIDIQSLVAIEVNELLLDHRRKA